MKTTRHERIHKVCIHLYENNLIWLQISDRGLPQVGVGLEGEIDSKEHEGTFCDYENILYSVLGDYRVVFSRQNLSNLAVNIFVSL